MWQPGRSESRGCGPPALLLLLLLTQTYIYLPLRNSIGAEAWKTLKERGRAGEGGEKSMNSLLGIHTTRLM